MWSTNQDYLSEVIEKYIWKIYSKYICFLIVDKN